VTPFADGALLRGARTARQVELRELVGETGLLVLAPHPDDETLGCGAVLAAAAAAGREVHVVVITDGGGSHPNSRAWSRTRLAERRRRELENALEVLGEGRITHECLEYPDQDTPLPDDPGMARHLDRLVSVMSARGLDTILSCWEHDPHVDHVRCAALADILLHRARERLDRHVSLTKYAVWGRFIEAPLSNPTDEELVRFDTVTAWRAAKERALAHHATQMTDLIDDDPAGFVMPAIMQRHFVEHDELFIRRRAP